MPLGGGAKRVWACRVACLMLLCAFAPMLFFADCAWGDVCASSEAYAAEGEGEDGDVECSVYAGYDRFETAAIQSAATFESSEHVIVVGYESWADALASSGLAGALDCPILYTLPSELNIDTKVELERLGASHVLVVGDAGAVSDAVCAEIAALPNSPSVERLSGDTVQDRQMAVLEYGSENGLWGPEFAFVASGVSFPDALSLAPVAVAYAAPIFLVDGQGELNDVQRTALVDLAKSGFILEGLVIAGGPSVVSEMTEGFVEAVTAYATGDVGNCVRAYGSSRYDTNVAVAEWAVEYAGMTWDGLAFASGTVPYDALAGSVMQGKKRSLILFADGTACAGVKEAVSHASEVNSYSIFGGTSVVSQAVRDYAALCFSHGGAMPVGAVRLSDGTYQWWDSTGVNQQAARDLVMSIAKSCLGIPYVWLGKYPENGGMDCASFIWHIYERNLGMEVGFETYDQMYAGRRIDSLSEAKPGDIILMYYGGWPNYNPALPEHVVLYAGNGMIYEEPDFGGQCQYVPLFTKNAGKMEIRRIIA